jgi:hypothetical protein
MLLSRVKVHPVIDDSIIKKGIYIYFPNINKDLFCVPCEEIDNLYAVLGRDIPRSVIRKIKHHYRIHRFPFEMVLVALQGNEVCGAILPIPTKENKNYAFSYKDFIAEFPDIKSLRKSTYAPTGDLASSGSNVSKRNCQKGFK